jgi:hypothetical protein
VKSPPNTGKEVEATNLQSPVVSRIPQYRRDIFPTSLLLTAEDLADFCQLIEDANERSKNIEFNNLDLSKFESAAQAREKVDDLVRVEYNYVAANGDSVLGLGIPKTNDRSFPDDLHTFFVSNSAYTKRAINVVPLNAIDAFLSFEKPTLKIDLRTLPSNPTENRSVINIYGRDEDWVISTTNRVQDFFRKRKATRPVIHGSGAYDYFLFLMFLPALIWLIVRYGENFLTWLEGKSLFVNVIAAIYALLLSLLLARFIFQYTRWLFPPIEYYKKSRVGAYVHRAVAATVGSTIILGAVYDIAKGLFAGLFGG